MYVRIMTSFSFFSFHRARKWILLKMGNGVGVTQLQSGESECKILQVLPQNYYQRRQNKYSAYKSAVGSVQAA